VELSPTLKTATEDRLLSATRISDHIMHVGVHALDGAVSDRFYKDIPGFRPPSEREAAWRDASFLPRVRLARRPLAREPVRSRFYDGGNYGEEAGPYSLLFA
jgi:hypothetical protein